MKKILTVLCLLLLVCSCSVKEPEPEPIGFGTTLYIDVDKSAGFESIEDLKEKKILYQPIINGDEVAYIKNTLIEQGFSEENFVETSSFRDYPSKIKDKEVDAWIVSDTTYTLMKDYYNDFDDSGFVHLGEFSMPIYEEKEEDSAIVNNKLYTEPFAVMLTGIDQRVDPDKNSRALNDVNLMMVVDPVHNHILTVSFPRDSYLYSPRLGHSRKMTEIGPMTGDVNAIKEAVGEVLEMEIPYYVQTSFSGFVDMIGHFGGVWIDVPMDTKMDMNSYRNVAEPYEVDKGYQKLYGEWALALARNRKYNGIHGGDYGRIRNQCLIVDGLINKIITYPEILEWAHIDWYARYIAAFNFTDDELKVLFALADKFHEEGYTVDNYFIENIGGMTDYGASVGYVTDYSRLIAQGKIELAFTGTVDADNPYYEEIMKGNVTGGANQSEYIVNEYDLNEVYPQGTSTQVDESEEVEQTEETSQEQ